MSNIIPLNMISLDGGIVIKKSNKTEDSAGSAGGVGGDDVIFYDYDGTILHSYSANEFLSLSQMPELPVQKGLICQEWNWSFDNTREYVSKYGKCYIGATYITDDGKTRFYLTISEYTDMGVTINVRENSSATVIVDWGDGSPTEEFGSRTSKSHTFSNVGDYCVTLDVLDGEILLGANANGNGALGYMSQRSPLSACTKVEIGKGVKGFTEYALAFNSKISYITIPNTFTTFGENSFYYDFAIKHITIPKSVVIIPRNAFWYCHYLISASLPDNINSIEDNAFNNCTYLCNVVIPIHTSSVGSYAFAYTNILDLIIPDSVTTIGTDAFKSSRLGMNIHVGNVAVLLDKLPWTASNNGDVNRIIAYGGYNWGDSIGLFDRCTNSYIPVERLREYCEGKRGGGTNKYFFINSISNLVTSIKIPSGTTSICEHAFSSCHNMESVIIPSSVETIGKHSFHTCYKLSSVDISHGVKTIDNYAFSSTMIREISIPDSVDTVGSSVFRLCYILEKVKLGTGITIIDSYVFSNCYSLKYVECPSVTSIGYGAFTSCLCLKDISFGSNVLSISDRAFDDCRLLRTCDFSNNTSVPTLSSSNAFYGYSNLEIIVPDELYDEWVAATNWSSISSKIKKKSEYYAQNN